MTTMTGWILLWGLLAPVQSSMKPTLTPVFIADEPGRSPAFLVECTNKTGQTHTSDDDVWPLRRSAIRLDGQPLLDETGGRVGSSFMRPIQPGENWRGLIELWQTRHDSSRAVEFDAMVRSPLLVPMPTGRHTIAVRCGAEWSDNLVFFIEK